MILDPKSLGGRTLAVALLLALMAGMWQAVIDPIRVSYTDRIQEIAQGKDLLTAYRRRFASLPALESRLATLKADRAQDGTYIEAANSIGASAALQGAVRRILEGHGGAPRTLQILPTLQGENLPVVRVRIDATLPVDRLRDFLYDLDTAIPAMSVDALDLRVPEALPSDATRSSARFLLRADLSALARVQSP